MLPEHGSYWTVLEKVWLLKFWWVVFANSRCYKTEIFINLENHRKRPQEGFWSIHLLRAGFTTTGYSGLHAVGFFSVSKDGDSASSVSSLLWCLISFTVQKCYLMFRGNLLCFSLCSLLLVLSLGTIAKCVTVLYIPLPLGISVH